MTIAADAQPRWPWIVLGLASVAFFAAAVFGSSATTQLRNTVILAVAVTCVSLPIALVTALLIERTDAMLRGVARTALFALVWIPLYLQAGAWQAGFGYSGWFTTLSGGAPLLLGWTAAIWIHVAAAIPFGVLIIGLGLREVEPELEEQALLDAPAWQVICLWTLPRSLPAVWAAAVWIMLTTATEMTITDLYQIRTYAEEVYQQLAINMHPEWAMENAAATAALLALLFAAASTVVTTWLPARSLDERRGPYCFHLGPYRFAAGLVLALVVGVVFVMPIASLVVQAGMQVVPVEGGVARSWSLFKAARVTVETLVRVDLSGQLTTGRFAGEIVRSGVVALLAAAGAVTLGGVILWWAAGRRSRAWIVPALIVVGLAMPAPLVGLAVIGLLNRPEIPGLAMLYDRSIAPVLLVQMWRSLPLAMLVLWPALRTISPATCELAALDGYGRWQTFFAILVPLRIRAFVVAWLVAAVAAYSELGATILVVPPGFEMVSVRVFNLLHYGVDDLVAGLYLTLLLGIGGVAAATWRLLRKATSTLA